MGDLQSLYSQARRLILAVSAGIERLENAEQRGNGVADAMAREVQNQLAQLRKISVDMDGLWRMHSLKDPPSKRDVWKRKVEQIAEESDALQGAFDRLMMHSKRRHEEEAQRQELLQRRNGGKPFEDIDSDMASRRHIQNSKIAIEEAYQTGVSVLGMMDIQRERLKSAHKKALDIMNAVGLSDSVLRLAERRIAVDKLIAYGGMIGITLIIVAIIYWYR